MSSVVISGYYGFGNAGDEAILEGIITSLKREGIDDLTVLSERPEATKKSHGVSAVNRRGGAELWRAVTSADVFVSGGGSLLQDKTSLRSPLYYLALIAMAKRNRVPVFLYAQGIGPLDRKMARSAARRVLAGVERAGVRDEESLDELIELGVPKDRIAVTADPVFSLDPPGASSRCRVMDRLDLPSDRLWIGVVWRSPRPWDRRQTDAIDRRLQTTLVKAIAPFAQSIGARIAMPVLHRDADLQGAENLGHAMSELLSEPVVVPKAGLSHRETMDLVASMDLVISVRYHGLVFAALAGVPAIGVTYDPKVRRLAAQLGAPCIDVEADHKELSQILHSTWQERELRSGDLRRRVEQLNKRAREEAWALASFIHERSGRKLGPDSKEDGFVKDENPRVGDGQGGREER